MPTYINIQKKKEKRKKKKEENKLKWRDWKKKKGKIQNGEFCSPID